VTRARHRVALERALAEVEAFGPRARAAWMRLRRRPISAPRFWALDDLIGAVTPDDVLDRVFAAFCVGK